MTIFNFLKRWNCKYIHPNHKIKYKFKLLFVQEIEILKKSKKWLNFTTNLELPFLKSIFTVTDIGNR